MSTFNNIPKEGTWGQAADLLNANFAQADVTLESLKNATTRNKGYYSTSSVLRSTHPSGPDGSIAYVGTESPFAVWRYEAGWYDTGIKSVLEGTDLTEYYTKAEIDRKLNSLSLGVSGGKVYIYLDGKIVGSGVEISGGTVSPTQSVILTRTNVSINANNTTDVGVRLSVQPSSNTTVRFASNSSYVSVSPTSLTFTSSNWNTDQTITITSSATSTEQSAVIDVTIDDATMATIQVSVVPYTITNLQVNFPSETIIGTQYQLTATVTPSDAPHELSWEITSGKSYAEIDPQTGLVTIKSTTTNESKIYIKCEDTVSGLTSYGAFTVQYDAPASVIYTEADCTIQGMQIDDETGEAVDSQSIDEDRRVSDFLPIVGFTKMDANLGATSFYYGCAVYDSDKNYLAGWSYFKTPINETLPDNVAYVRFTAAIGRGEYSFKFYN